MTREQKIEELAKKYEPNTEETDEYYKAKDFYTQGILAGIALRDAELLAMEFNKEECRKMAKASCDEEGYCQHEANIYIQGYKHGAGQKHEQFIKAIKGDG